VRHDERVLDTWRGRLAREARRLRNDGRAALLWSLRITVAATASYVVGTILFPGTQPLLAPLTAMLVVQVTPVSLLASGLDRVVAVVTGVSLAVVFSTVVPLEWWSLGVLIFVAITLGQALRLQNNLIEVAISGMLVLGVGVLSAESAAWQRIAETLVGAAVGIAANLLFPPKVPVADAAGAIDGLADSISDLLSGAADDLVDLVEHDRDVAPVAAAWLDEARRITHDDVPRVGASLLHAEQGRRLNVRAVGTPDVGPGLRQGIEVLEHSAVTVRSMFRAVLDATAEGDPDGWLHQDTAGDVLLGLAQTLRELAAGVDAFGALVRGEAGPATSAQTVHELRAALEGMREARGRLEDLLVSDADPELLELHASLLSAVKRILQETDLERRVRRQLQLWRTNRPRTRRPRPSAPPSPPPQGAASDDALPDAETMPMPRLDDDPDGR
jgi:hypothetical protein